MSAAGNHPASRPTAAATPFLATDIGGTHARVALLRAAPSTALGVETLAYEVLACADFRGLGELLQRFVQTAATTPVKHCVLACAGQVVGDEVLNDNAAWPIRLSAVRQALALDELAVLNDFEALGHAIGGRRIDAARLLCGPDTQTTGPVLVIGPGTGLGAAACLPVADGYRVLTTEAGQMDFAPQSLRERAVLAQLAPDGGYLPWERVLSGPGLLATYRALCASDGRSPQLTTPEAVTAAATRRTDVHAVQAVDVFCAALGSFSGNLAMTFMAFGGIYLAGGFLHLMFDLLQPSAFAERFLHARSVRPLLERMPVRVVSHGHLGVLGAARWYLRQCALRPGAQPMTPATGAPA
ncbi:MAG: glucokinase [Rhodanobacter sp.]|nr:MAG: glucokinase [Rhodanobacter sp.]TAM09708.1 MAG: glucokinase [Rhodanobacter sp.]TAM37662.1 MAG: glucokinase [Rhodanobacter sp.]